MVSDQTVLPRLPVIAYLLFLKQMAVRLGPILKNSRLFGKCTFQNSFMNLEFALTKVLNCENQPKKMWSFFLVREVAINILARFGIVDTASITHIVLAKYKEKSIWVFSRMEVMQLDNKFDGEISKFLPGSSHTKLFVSLFETVFPEKKNTKNWLKELEDFTVHFYSDVIEICDEVIETRESAFSAPSGQNQVDNNLNQLFTEAATEAYEIEIADQNVCSDTSIHLFTPDQLYTIITELSQAALEHESEYSKWKLENLHKQLTISLNFAHVELLHFVTVVLQFLEKNYRQVKFSIRHCHFQPDKHQFLRDIYRRTEDMSDGELTDVFMCYPESIDPVDSDGISKITSAFLEGYYEIRRHRKKGFTMNKLSQDTGIPLKWIKKKFRTFQRERRLKVEKSSN